MGNFLSMLQTEPSFLVESSLNSVSCDHSSQRLPAACSAMLSWGIVVGWLLPVSSYCCCFVTIVSNNCKHGFPTGGKKSLASFNADFKAEMDWAVKLRLCHGTISLFLLKELKQCMHLLCPLDQICNTILNRSVFSSAHILIF